MFGQDIDALEYCLGQGDDGRREWNARRGEVPHVGEAISMPLTFDLSETIKIHTQPPNLWLAHLNGADLSGYDLSAANLSGAQLSGANLRGADLTGAHLMVTDLSHADLRGADLSRANLLEADLTGADLTGATLVGTSMLRTKVDDAVLDGCHVHGISVWGVEGLPKSQRDLTITAPNEPTITVDDIEVGQFVYLILKNEKLKSVLQTVTSKVVLLLGRFTDERKTVLDQLRERLRNHNYSPVLFDFEPSDNLDVSDTITLLARMARFVIADLTDPRSVQQELTMIAPNVMVAIQPIIQKGHEPWAMYSDLERRSRGLLPVVEYRDVAQLLASLEPKVIGSAEARRLDLLPNGGT